jgi:multidrug resistance efflux pump
VVVGFAVRYTMDRVLLHTSLDGVVNAPLIALRASIDGRVELGSATRAGGVVEPGAVLFRISEDRLDTRSSMELKSRAESAEEAVRALDSRIASLVAQQTDLRNRGVAHKQVAVNRLEALRAQAQAELEGARAKVTSTEAERRRAVDLAAQGIIARARFEDINAEATRARSEVGRLTASIARYDAELGGAHQGIFLADGYSDVPYSQQRVEELDVRIADLRIARETAEQNRGELLQMHSTELLRLQKLTHEALQSSTRGIMWTVMVSDGVRVSRGDVLGEVADCDNSFVEATLPERGFNVVRPGDPVRVRLSGAKGEMPGAIRSVRGAGAVGASGRAAGVERNGSGLMWVVVNLEPSALRQQRAGGCQIGRSATVLF